MEKLLGIEVTERCKFIRTVMSEISRVCDHLTCVGASAMELGAFTVFLYMIKAREFLWELVEDVTGARLTISYGRVGGVKADLPEGFAAKVSQAFKETREVLDEVHRLLTGNRIFMDRMVGVGGSRARRRSATRITGPLLRAVGVGYDVRRAQPHWAYDRVEFEVPTQKDGDNYARYLVRMAEMEQSMRIAEQALAQMPGGPINVDFEGRPLDPGAYVDQGKQGKTEGLLLVPIHLSPNLQGQNRAALQAVNTSDKRVTLPPKETAYGSIEGLMNHFMLIMEGYGIRPPPGEAYFASEGANGELGFYVVSDGGDRPYRVRCRPPCLPPRRRAAPHDRGRDDRRPHPHVRLGEHDRRRARPMTYGATGASNRPPADQTGLAGPAPTAAPSFSPEQLAEVRRLQGLYPDKRGALLPVLHMAQETFGWISLRPRNTWPASSSSRRRTCTRS